MATQGNLRIRVSVDVLKDPNYKIRSLSAGTVDRAIQDAYDDMQMDLPGWFGDTDDDTTITGLASTETYSLPSDFLILQYATRQGNRIDKVTKKRVKSFYPPPAPGIPTNYYIYGNQIGLYPTPGSNGTLVVAYTKRLPAISSNQDSLNPEYLDYALACLAGAKCFRQVYKVELADYREAEYKKEITRARGLLIQDENLTFDTNPRGIGPGSYYLRP